MRFVIVTGMSGAGKSSVLKMLEDAGYFCVDNLPVPLVLKFAEISWHEENMMSKVALGIDIRSRNHLNMLEDVLKSVRDEGYDYEILFMDCKDDKLIKRYKETRRNHPLAAGGRIETAIAEERQRLSFLKKQSDYIIDTSNLLIRDLKKEIQHIFVEDKDYSNFYITLLSFGFKYGIPADAGSGISDAATGRLAEIKKRGVLTVATEPYWVPCEFIDPSLSGDAQYVGSDIELAKYIAKKMNVALEIVPLEFTAVLSSIPEGKYDLAISALAYTPERAEAMELSKGYYFTDDDEGYGILTTEELLCAALMQISL